MKFQTLFAAALLAAVLSACSHSGGVQVTPEQAAQFEKGKSSYSDVVAKLGKPTSTVDFANGTKAASYSYAQVGTRPETFIPIVGAFAGGSDVKSNMVTFMFDQKGMLTDYMSTASQSSSKLGGGTTTSTQTQAAP